jgi:biopolymer transport protein ExbB
MNRIIRHLDGGLEGQGAMKFYNILIHLRSAFIATLVAALFLPALAFAQAPATSAPSAAAAPPAVATPAVPSVLNAPAAQAPVTSAPATTLAPAPEITLKLPRDLSPWGMFLAADIVVKAVMLGLAFASVLTWTIWFAKVIELIAARRRLRATIAVLSEARSLADCVARLPERDDTAGALIRAAETEFRLSADALDPVGVKERIASRLERIEAAAGRRMIRGTGILATVGAIAPFVGLFGTVWGIMNSFIGISRQHTTNLAVVAPGIAEALLATALGLVAAIPAVIMYNMFSRSIATYRALQADAAAEVLRLVSRDLDRGASRPAARLRPVPAE